LATRLLLAQGAAGVSRGGGVVGDVAAVAVETLEKGSALLAIFGIREGRGVGRRFGSSPFPFPLLLSVHRTHQEQATSNTHSVCFSERIKKVCRGTSALPHNTNASEEFSANCA
jgi:hypothetical protein